MTITKDSAKSARNFLPRELYDNDKNKLLRNIWEFYGNDKNKLLRNLAEF